LSFLISIRIQAIASYALGANLGFHGKESLDYFQIFLGFFLDYVLLPPGSMANRTAGCQFPIPTGWPPPKSRIGRKVQPRREPTATNINQIKR